MINTLIRTSCVAAVAIAAITSCDMTNTHDDYVSIIITRDSQVVDVVSIDLDDSHVARTIFDSERVITINTLTRQIDDAALARICRELNASDVECFS